MPTPARTALPPTLPPDMLMRFRQMRVVLHTDVSRLCRRRRRRCRVPFVQILIICLKAFCIRMAANDDTHAIAIPGKKDGLMLAIPATSLRYYAAMREEFYTKCFHNVGGRDDIS